MTQSNSTPVPLGDFPIGTILSFSGILNTSVLEKAGWLYCNGEGISRTDYEGLFAVIGTANGGGDSSTTFNLPDFRGTFLRGTDQGTKRDPNASDRPAAFGGGNTGDNVGSVQLSAMGQPHSNLITSSDGKHIHSLKSIPVGKSSYYTGGDKLAEWNEGSGKTDVAGNHNHEVTGGGDKETRPVNVYSYFIIKFAQL
jgi:hypothetical protein